MKNQKKPRISLICAIAENDRAIGKDNALLWNIPADLQYFKSVTLGKPVIMGLNTFNSLPFALPGRLNIVLSKDQQKLPDGVLIASSLAEAYKMAAEVEDEEIFIIGGGSVYAQAIAGADRLYLTLVEGNYPADVYFPDFSDFQLISEAAESSSGYNYKFTIWEKK